MNINFEFLSVLFVVIGQAMFLAYKLGRIEEKITTLEQKQDKHNEVISRMYKVEKDIDKAHLRIDFLEGKEDCE